MRLRAWPGKAGPDGESAVVGSKAPIARVWDSGEEVSGDRCGGLHVQARPPASSLCALPAASLTFACLSLWAQPTPSFFALRGPPGSTLSPSGSSVLLASNPHVPSAWQK